MKDLRRVGKGQKGQKAPSSPKFTFSGQALQSKIKSKKGQLVGMPVRKILTFDAGIIEEVGREVTKKGGYSVLSFLGVDRTSAQANNGKKHTWHL